MILIFAVHERPFVHVVLDAVGHVFSCRRVPARLFWVNRVDPSALCVRLVHSPSQPTTHPSSHPVCRRPTRSGAGAGPGVQVERATVRTTWTPGPVSARLCLGRRQTGWEPTTHATTGRQTHVEPPPSRSRSAPAGGMMSVPVSPPARALPAGARRRSARSGPEAGAKAQRSRERARRSGAQPGT